MNKKIQITLTIATLAISILTIMMVKTNINFNTLLICGVFFSGFMLGIILSWFFQKK